MSEYDEIDLGEECDICGELLLHCTCEDDGDEQKEPSQKADMRPICPQCGQSNGFHRESCPLLPPTMGKGEQS